MNELNLMLQGIVANLTKPERVLGNIVAKKLKAKGQKCSEAERTKIGSQLYEFIRQNNNATVDGSILCIGRGRKTRHITISADDLEKFSESAGAALREAVPAMSWDIAKVLYGSIKKNSEASLADQRAILVGFEARLYSRWKKALDAFDLFISVARDAGSQAFTYLNRSQFEQRKHLVIALARLQTRACQIAGEIQVLLKSGYADGAHARWRTLHEIEVVTALLSKHGELLAERYLSHEHIESLRAARQFNEHARALGERKISKAELVKMEASVQRLCSRFGDTFKNRNGWACTLFEKNPGPSFSDLEAKTEFDHIRPFYKMASHNVHAEPKGIMFRIGVKGRDLILSGPSNAGLEEAARLAGYSLLNITLCLLTVETTLDSLTYGQTLVLLEEDARQVFSAVAAKLEAEEERMAKKRKFAQQKAGKKQRSKRRPQRGEASL
jgi:uncharacterized protein DUF5677